MRHDFHHVACGYGTDLPGEAEVSAWEVRRGLRGLGLYVGAIVLGGALFGLAIAPRRTVRAWRSGAGVRGSLFQTTRTYDELLAMNVGELRALLSVPAQGLARERRELTAAPAILAGASAPLRA